MNPRHALSIAGALSVAFVACGRDERPPPSSPAPAPASETTTTAGTLSGGMATGRIMNDDAAMLLTNTRCQRESSCDNVGASRRFPDPENCRRTLFPEANLALRPEECPAGVDGQ